MSRFDELPGNAARFSAFSLLFIVLLLAANISYAEITREAAKGEKLITLAVENMT